MLKSTLTMAAVAAALTTTALPAAAICATAMPMVHTSVTANLDNTWHYEAQAQGEMQGCSQLPILAVTDFYLPYFSDMGITHVMTAAGWNFNIEASNDVFNLGGGVMHFSTANRPTTSDIFSLATTASFDAAFDGTKGPYKVSMYNPLNGSSTSLLGDPLIPASPLTLAGLARGAGAVPEPGSALLLLAGVMGLAATTRRRRH